MSYRFDADYEEHVELSDGTHVLLRPLRASDKELLARGFEHLSPESRYRRFFAPKSRLSSQDLRYLTEVDGVDHVAIGALRADEPEQGLGVARFVRFVDEPEVAEPAIAVLDEVQHKGLGHLLLARLTSAALERGVKRFRSVVLAENVPMRALIHEVAPDAVEHTEDDVLTIEVPLHEPPHDRPRGPLQELLSLAARGAFVLLEKLWRGATHGDA